MRVLRPGELLVILPVVVLLFLGFLEYAFSYLLCITQVNNKLGHRGAAIALIVIFNVLLLVLLTNWLLLLVRGPGELPHKVKPYDLKRFVEAGRDFDMNSMMQQTGDDEASLEPHMHSYNSDLSNSISQDKDDCSFTQPPDIFPCDMSGLPPWCFQCQTIKVLRSSHSSALGPNGRCVPKFDHFCSWVGSVIGHRNYPHFVYFVFTFWSLFILVIVSLAVYSARVRDFDGSKTIHPAFIVAYIICGLWFFMLSALVWSFVILVTKNETTLDEMKRNRTRRKLLKEWRHVGGNAFSPSYVNAKREFIEKARDADHKYFNVSHPLYPQVRFIVKVELSDYPYDRGFMNNLKDITRKNNLQDVASILDYESRSVSMSFKRKCYDRIEKKNAVVFGSIAVNQVST